VYHPTDQLPLATAWVPRYKADTRLVMQEVVFVEWSLSERDAEEGQYIVFSPEPLADIVLRLRGKKVECLHN
jgi:hypothetical protein